MALVLLAAQTGAGQSAAFRVLGQGDGGSLYGSGHPVTICVPGLAGAEVATVEFSLDSGANWFSYFDGASASPLQFTVSRNAIAFYAPGLLRVNKGATASAVGVWVSKPDDL